MSTKFRALIVGVGALILGFGLALPANAQVINGDNTSENLVGTPNDDQAYGHAGADTITLLAGNDYAEGGVGNDFILGRRDNDTLHGNLGKDTLTGNDGFDCLAGEEDADTLRGGRDFDCLFGGSSGDALFGGSGGDTLVLGPGADSANGGTQDDVIYVGVDGKADYIDGGDGHDTVVTVNGSIDPLDTFVNVESFENGDLPKGCSTAPPAETNTFIK